MKKKQYWDLNLCEMDKHFESFIKKSADEMILELRKKISLKN